MSDPTSLKGSAATEVDDALRAHQDHHLIAEEWYYDNGYGCGPDPEPLLCLRCWTCNVTILELEE